MNNEKQIDTYELYEYLANRIDLVYEQKNIMKDFKECDREDKPWLDYYDVELKLSYMYDIDENYMIKYYNELQGE